MIGIVDYGLGNLTSVAGAIEKVGFEPIITSDPSELARMDKLILPGVGAFGDGMANLKSRDLVEPLRDLVLSKKKPFLGICLGFQLIAQSSEEFGDHEGLAWIDAKITRLAPGEGALRIPHVGWNDVHQMRKSVLFDGVPDDGLFYYVHSYRMQTSNTDIVVGECDYGDRFISIIQADNIYATQFHPEKSQLHGLTLLKNFLEKG
ncbi:MAG: imidazole glycerol phosphate synthase subunit HisH [Rhodospirillales bacterium]|jgi:glutamine amidotransferase